MRVPIHTLITRVLIVVGAALIVAFVSYEAYNYPWKTVFSTDMIQEETALADPALPVLPEGWSVTEYNWAMGNGSLNGIDMSAMLVSDRMLSPPYAASPDFYNTDIQWLGILKIPVLDVSVNLFDGIGAQLSYGAARAGGSAMPGAEGNFVVAAGRQYVKMRPFRHIDKLKSGDSVIIKSGGRMYTYSVYESFVVTPHDLWVMDAVADEPYTLTLITATPVTNPADRLIVRARLSSFAD